MQGSGSGGGSRGFGWGGAAVGLIGQAIRSAGQAAGGAYGAFQQTLKGLPAGVAGRAREFYLRNQSFFTTNASRLSQFTRYLSTNFGVGAAAFQTASGIDYFRDFKETRERQRNERLRAKQRIQAEKELQELNRQEREEGNW